MCKKNDASRLNNLTTRDEDSHMWEAHYDIACLNNLATIAHEDGSTSSFTCNNINLAAWLPLSYFDISDNENNFTISSGNDITGATIENKEYALIGLDAGTALVDITSPTAPIYIAFIATNNPMARCHDEACEVTNSAWRDIKTYSDANATYALIVSEEYEHGLQVAHLNLMIEDYGNTIDQQTGEGTTQVYTSYNDTSFKHYDFFGSAHNIAVNQDSGYAYVMGPGYAGCNNSNTTTPLLIIYNLDNIGDTLDVPTCYTNSTDPYYHDIQAVMYNGPDEEHTGKEIVIASAGQSGGSNDITILDASDKNNTTEIGRFDGDADFDGVAADIQYSHQGWLTEDQHYFFFDDELDEYYDAVSTQRTLVFDLSDLESPTLLGAFHKDHTGIDHNQYTHKGFLYQSNYTKGVEIYKVNDFIDAAAASSNTSFTIGPETTHHFDEVASFDTYPENNDTQFEGSWSNYPFFESDTLIVSDINRGLFILKPELCANEVNGDVNGDGQTSILDITTMVSFILFDTTNSLNQCQINAIDLTEDGQYNILDVISMVSLIIDTNRALDFITAEDVDGLF